MESDVSSLSLDTVTKILSNPVIETQLTLVSRLRGAEEREQRKEGRLGGDGRGRLRKWAAQRRRRRHRRSLHENVQTFENESLNTLAREGGREEGRALAREG